MALKLSTKMRNDLLSGKELRKSFEDAVIKIYTGTAPSTADEAASGTLLVTVTKSSGTVSVSEVSTAMESKLNIGSHASAETFGVTINGVLYHYVNTPDAGDATAVAAAYAKVIDAAPDVEAHACGTADIYIRSKFAGVEYTCVVEAAVTGTQTLTLNAVANATADTIRFGSASDGVISKASETWSGVGVSTGTAGYFRIVNSADDGLTDAVNKVFPRLQGNVGISGTEMTLSNTTITSGATQTIDTATITMPVS
jgi:hypothetical protein